MMDTLEPASFSIGELLQWYKHAGVDIALDDAPIDQFALFQRQQQEIATKKAEPKPPYLAKKSTPRKASTATNQMANAAIPDENAIAQAKALASSANSLDELREILMNFKGCNLCLSAKNLVFGDGNPQADIMLVGDAPGRDEDIHGLPFVGRCGQLLEQMLGAINLQREQVYLTNVIPWRPPGNRTPTQAETEICRPFIERHIELVSPKILVLLGGASTKSLLNSREGFLKLRGRWQKYGELDCLPTLDPAYLLRQPAQKRLAWQDLLKLASKLQELAD